MNDSSQDPMLHVAETSNSPEVLPPRNPRLDSLEQLEALRLSKLLDIAGLSTGETAFDYVHLGNTAVPVGALLDFIASQSGLVPPRTGHLGNWKAILTGRSGATDFNQVICRSGYGYPLIYCFTQTEAENAGVRSGDWVYKPGSILTNQWEQLPLYTWSGESFAQRSREHSYFCPCVQTCMEGRLVPLVQLHWQRMQELSDCRFKLEASIITSQAEGIHKLLGTLIERASHRQNTRRSFQSIISHWVGLDGAMARAEIRSEGTGYWLDDCCYRSRDALIAAAMLPFQAATNPDKFFADIASYPPKLPILSHLVMSILGAAFFTHRNCGSAPTGHVEHPFTLHWHWGARDMAGYPPLRNGYFASDAAIRSLKWMTEAIIVAHPEFRPICFTLLPASIFMLCTGDAFDRDAKLLQILFESIGSQQDPTAISDAVGNWHSKYSGSISNYFRSRFRRGSDISIDQTSSSSQPVEPRGFRQLTISQACKIVGALVTIEESAS